MGAFDGSKNSYYARVPIQGDSQTFPPFQLVLDDGEKARDFTVRLKKAAVFTLDVDRMQEILRDTSESMPMIQALDVILRSLPSLRMVPVGRSFFFPPDRPFSLGGGKEAWSGYYQSVRPTMGWKLMLNVDTAATAFYSEQSVFDFLCTVLRKCRPADAAKPLTDRERVQFSRNELNDYERKQFCREIKGLKIVVTHLPYPRKYKVIDVTRLSAKKQSFSLQDGSPCTVQRYFREQYPDSNLSSRSALPPCWAEESQRVPAY